MVSLAAVSRSHLSCSPITLELMKSCADTTVSQLKTILELETSPFTQNNHYFQESRDSWRAQISRHAPGFSAAPDLERGTYPPPAGCPNEQADVPSTAGFFALRRILGICGVVGGSRCVY